MPELLDTPPPAGATPVIVDAPPPPGVTAAASPQLVDGPPPAGVMAPWQQELMDVKLPNGATTKLRSDGYVWLDPSKGYKETGWATPKWNGGWKIGPDQPERFTPANKEGLKDPKVMGDAEIAVRLLGMTPEQFVTMTHAVDYQPGKLAAGFDDPNGLWAKYVPKEVKSVTGGLRKGFNAMEQLAYKPMTAMGNSAGELYSRARGMISQMNQNINQGRGAQQGGFDPLHMGAQFAPGMVMASGLAPAAAPVQAVVPAEQVGLNAALARGAVQAPQVVAATALTTPGTVPERLAAGGAAGLTQPVANAAVEQVLAPGVQKLLNLAKGIKDVVIGRPMKPLPGRAGELEAIAEQHGVPTMSQNLTTSEASNINDLAALNTAAPNTSGGLGKSNVEQQKAAQNAAKRLVGELQKRMNAKGWANFNVVQEAAAAGDQEAIKILDIAKRAGENPALVVQAEGNINRFIAEARVERAAQRAAALDTGVEREGGMTNLVRVAQEELKRLEGEGLENAPTKVVAHLKKIIQEHGRPAEEAAATTANGSGESAASVEAMNRLAGEQAKGQVRVYFNPKTNQIIEVPPTVDAVDMQAAKGTLLLQRGVGKNDWTLLDANTSVQGRPATADELSSTVQRAQTELNKWYQAKNPPAAEATPKFKATYTNMANYRKGVMRLEREAWNPEAELSGGEASRVLRRLRDAVDQDMQEHAATVGPEVAKADRFMRDLYKKEVLPFDNRKALNYMRSETTEQIANRFKNMTPEELEMTLPALGEKGKAAVRLHMIDQAIMQSMDNTRLPGYEFDPLKFAAKLKDDKFQRTLGLTVPKGGEEKWLVDGFGELMNHLKTAGKTGSTEGAFTLSQKVLSYPSLTLRWMLTTRPGKQFLLQASDLKAGSPQMAALVDRMSKVASAEVGKTTKETE